MIGMQLRVKINTEELLGMILNMCRSKCISSLNALEASTNEGECQTSILKRIAAKGVRNTLHVFCIV